jgi:hypothetical protein
MRLWNGPFFNASDKPNPKEPIGLWLCKQSHAKNKEAFLKAWMLQWERRL